MKNLKYNSLLLVGDEDRSFYFKKYFKDVFLVKNDNEALAIYQKKPYPIVFLSDEIEIAKKIKAYNRETIIVLASKNISKKTLMESVLLHLSGCIEMPFERGKVEHLLESIDGDLEVLDRHLCRLKSGYTFDVQYQILYDEKVNEVKLTKKERRLMSILIESKYQFVGIETLEYNIWEKESMEEDCRGRFKALLNTLRKKLPKGSIVNRYGMGYKLVMG